MLPSLPAKDLIHVPKKANPSLVSNVVSKPKISAWLGEAGFGSKGLLPVCA